METKIFKFVGIGALVAMLLFLVVAYFSIQNTAINKQENVRSHEKSYNQEFDNMFKKIAQIAQIPDHALQGAKESFKEIYTPLIEGRYKDSRNDGLMRWIQESNPQFDTKEYYSLYGQLANTVEASRDALTAKGNEWITAVQDYNSYIRKAPNSWFLSTATFPREEAKIITSSKTEEAVKTDKDDDINLFDKK